MNMSKYLDADVNLDTIMREKKLKVYWARCRLIRTRTVPCELCMVMVQSHLLTLAGKAGTQKLQKKR